MFSRSGSGKDTHHNTTHLILNSFSHKSGQHSGHYIFKSGSKSIHLLLAASFLPLGNKMPKATRNSLYGLRTKWSMADDVCWQKSQRLGGYLLMGTGILGVILVSLLPVEWGTFALVGLLLIMAVAATVGSYVIWKKENEKSTA